MEAGMKDCVRTAVKAVFLCLVHIIAATFDPIFTHFEPISESILNERMRPNG